MTVGELKAWLKDRDDNRNVLTWGIDKYGGHSLIEMEFEDIALSVEPEQKEPDNRKEV